MRIRHVVAATLVVISVPTGLTAAQDKSSQPIQDRRDQLAKYQEGLADPDPLMRVAVMESIIAGGDASGTYLAMRTAFASDDPAMRNLAMRAWVAGLKRINLSLVLPGDLQKQVDAALLEQKQTSALFQPNSWLGAWSRRGFQLALGFTDVDVEKNAGKIYSLPTFTQQNALDFTLSGTEIYATFQVDFSPGSVPCHVRLSPTAALVVEGTVACEFNVPSPPLRVTAPML